MYLSVVIIDDSEINLTPLVYVDPDRGRHAEIGNSSAIATACRIFRAG